MSPSGDAAGSSKNSGIAAAQPGPPSDLRIIAPFLQRAHETRKADPALSYWCNYHAAQLGIAHLGSLGPASRTFLTELMDTLESQKRSLQGNELVHGDDLVAKAHVENMALKVFGGADAEDRAGKATKATARRFLVAGNFIEVLTNFGALDSEMEEKLKYAKWKAADIAKALREGRTPAPGPAGGLQDEEGVGHSAFSGADGTMAGLDAAGSRLGGLGSDEGGLPSTEELDAEMARLTADGSGVDMEARARSSNVEHSGLAISPTAVQSQPQPARTSFDNRSGDEHSNGMSSSSADGGKVNFSKPLRGNSYVGHDGGIESTFGHGGVESMSGTEPSPVVPLAPEQFGPSSSVQDSTPLHPDFSSGGRPSSISPRPPLPNPPSSSSVHTGARSPLPIPPLGPGQMPQMSPQPSQPPQFGYEHIPQVQPSAPPALPIAAAPALPPPIATAAHNLPTSLDHAQTARVQKLAKWAVSALDYEDVETARKQLREALDICEGRTIAK